MLMTRRHNLSRTLSRERFSRPTAIAFPLVAILLIAILALPLACGKKEAGEIKIGVITPLSGEGATYGEATKRGVDLAVAEINAQGGVNGKKVRIIYEDDQINPQVGTQAIQKLINVDKVPVILGAFGSSVSLAVAPIAEQNKVVLFSASSTADALKDAGDYFFRNVPPNSRQGQSAARFALEKLNAKKAAILYMNNDYGISLTESFKTYFQNNGGSVVETDVYNPGDRDFRSQLSKIKDTNPDVVFYPGHYQESGLILKQARELGINVPFIGGDGSYSPELISIAGNAAEGSYYTLMAMGYGVADEQIDQFTNSFETSYGIEPDVYSAYAYDAIQVIVNAIRNGGYSSDGIKQALYATKNFLGVTGYTSFDANGEVDKEFSVYIVKDGKFEPYQ